MDKQQEKLQRVLDWHENKPKTNAQWAEDVKAEGLEIRTETELVQMKDSHESKLTRVQKDLDKFINWPDAVRYELMERFSTAGLTGKELTDAVEKEFQEQLTYYQWKVGKLGQSVERITKAKDLIAEGRVLP